MSSVNLALITNNNKINFMQELKTKLFCTLGPSSYDSKVINRLTDLGVDLFRINLSHTK